MTTVLDTAQPTRSGGTDGPPRGGRAREVLVGLVGYLAAQLSFLALLHQLAPRFFWLDDQQAQYVPAFHWLGSTMEDGRVPLLDPDSGAGGNYVADPQYGALDPTHWLISWLVGQQDDVVTASWWLGGTAVVLLGTGVTLLLLAHRVRPALAASVAVGVASTGFFLWIGSSWWPVMWGTAWLPWLWLGLVTRRWPGVVVTGVAAWQLAASGYPYVLIPAGALVVGFLVERRRRYGLRRELRTLTTRSLAGLAGLLAAAPGLLAAQEMAPASTRTGPMTTAVGSTGGLIPNLLDAVVGGATLTPSVSGEAGGFLFVTPLAATVVFAFPALALVRWRWALRTPGVLTAAVLTAVALLLTQMPTDVGQLRYPFRYLAVLGPAVGLLVALGLTAAAVVSRTRVLVAFGLVGLQFVLAVLRGPALWKWHGVAAVLAVAALSLLVVVLLRTGAVPVPDGGERRLLGRVLTGVRGRARRPGWARAAAVLLVVAATASPLVSVGSLITVGARLEQQQDVAATGEPARQALTRTEWGETVAEFRERAVDTDTSLTAIVYAWSAEDAAGAAGGDQGWGWGVVQGNANLLAGLRPGFGYVAVGHREWSERWCEDLFGRVNGVPSCVRGLLRLAPDLGAQWVDLLSSDEVLLSSTAPPRLVQHFQQGWTAAGEEGPWTRWLRRDALPGRVTWASAGAELSAVREPGAPAADSLFYSGRPGESVRVSTPAAGGQLVFRIPAWPGLRAEVDGEEVPVDSVADTLLSVDLPGGLDDARLDLYFDPLGDRLLMPAGIAGGLLLLLALGLDVRPRLRLPSSARRGAGSRG